MESTRVAVIIVVDVPSAGIEAGLALNATLTAPPPTVTSILPDCRIPDAAVTVIVPVSIPFTCILAIPEMLAISLSSVVPSTQVPLPLMLNVTGVVYVVTVIPYVSQIRAWMVAVAVPPAVTVCLSEEQSIFAASCACPGSGGTDDIRVAAYVHISCQCARDIAAL